MANVVSRALKRAKKKIRRWAKTDSRGLCRTTDAVALATYMVAATSAGHPPGAQQIQRAFAIMSHVGPRRAVIFLQEAAMPVGVLTTHELLQIYANPELHVGQGT